jgi:hypothetical protein
LCKVFETLHGGIMKRLIVVISVLLLLISGCTDEYTPAAPEITPEYTLTISGLPVVLTAIGGTERQLNFTVQVTDENQRPVSGVVVSLALISGEGSFATPEVTTDTSGLAEATCTFLVPVGESSLCIVASAGASSAQYTIALYGTKQPVRLEFFADKTDLRVLPNENAEVNLTAIITDSDGVGVPGIEVTMELKPVAVGGSVFGTLIQPPPTGMSGSTWATFNSNGGRGDVIVSCRLKNYPEEYDIFRGEIWLTVLVIADQSSQFWLDAPELIRVHPDSVGRATITATLLDSIGQGVYGVPVRMTATIGSLDREIFTDEFGIATSWFLCCREFGTTIIIASIEGTELSDTARIIIESTFGNAPVLQLTSDVSYIYADNGRTVANLTALFMDENDRAIPNAIIDFTTDYGVVSPASGITDANGVMRAVFTDVGIPSRNEDGDIVPAHIVARNAATETQDMVEVTILPLKIIVEMQLTTDQHYIPPFQVGSIDSIRLNAICFMRDHEVAPPGIVVHFDTDLGRFMSNIVDTDSMGMARNVYLPPTTPGIAHLIIWVQNPDSSILSEELEYEFIHGPSNRITVTADPGVIYTDDPSSYSLITATVADTFGNSVGEGKLVNFSTTLGSLNRLAAQTDEHGQAIVQLSPGVLTGVAEVTAVVATATGTISGSTEVGIRSNGPNLITLVADPREVEPEGETALVATLYDERGSLYEAPTMVVFELVNQPPLPWGGSINNHGAVDSVLCTGGIAMVGVAVGRESNRRQARAYTWRDEARQSMIAAQTYYTVTVGPPHAIDIDFDTEGVDAGGAVWAIEVYARVFDENLNPVEDGIPVQFSCDSIATIGEASTGNASRSGRSEPGVAFAIIAYNSRNTFDTLTVNALVRSAGRDITAERGLTLPLQGGQLLLRVTPESWDFSEHEEDTAVFTCTAELRDGHEVIIERAPVLFSSNRGHFSDYELGDMVVYLRGTEDDFFLDDVTPEVNVQIEARVVGYEDVAADPVIVVVTRNE